MTNTSNDIAPAKALHLHWLPNALTLMRCFLAITVAVIIVMVVQNELFLLQDRGYDMPAGMRLAHLEAAQDFRRLWGGIALGVFTIASATDYLDGYLARRWKAESRFGRLLDPVADKLAVGLPLLAIVLAAELQLFVLVPVVLIIFRDLLITILRFSGKPTVAIRVSVLAKWKTAFEMLTVFLFLFLMAVIGWQSTSLEIWLDVWLCALWISAALSVYTGTQYLVRLAVAGRKTRTISTVES